MRMPMRSSPNSVQFINVIIQAGERLDPVFVNEVFNFTIEALEANYEITKPTLTEYQDLRHQRRINTAYMILTLFNTLRLPETLDLE
jgi:hypothetical protein